MNVTVVVGENLNWLGIAIFAGMGYLCGSLFRNIGIIKIIAMFVILPVCLDIVMKLNNVIEATIPFLLMALVGFWGIDKTKHRIGKFLYDVKYYAGYLMRHRR